MANAADNYQWNADNVFDWTSGGLNEGAPEEISSRFGDAWDLNPLAWNVGMAADGVRDSLSTSRDAFLQPKMKEYRDKVGAGNSADDDYGLFHDQDFQNYVKTGQTSKGYKVDDTPAGRPQTVSQQWTQQQAPQVQPAAEDPRRNLLYETLMKRASGSVVPDRSDPTIRAQADAYGANEERAMRNSISDSAEAGGPFANLAGETRMARERMGQRTGAFEANLMGQELSARRADTMSALQAAIGMNDRDAVNSLQERLANLDAAMKQQGLNLQDKQIGTDWQKTLLGNDQFMRQLGLNEWDRTNYWDALRSGYLG